MKNKILLIIIGVLSFFSCKAQTPIINITDDNGNQISGAYYKDIDNLLNPYLGTYLYANGNTSLKIVLQKKTMSFDGKIYEDIIIGEYQYIKDGVEIINTLHKLNQMLSNKRLHSIKGNFILMGTEMGCFDYSTTEKRLVCGLVENDTDNWGQLSIRTTTVNNQPAIKVFLYWHYRSRKVGDPELLNASFPGGHYIMIKQP